jgi:hypothetical protein
MSAEPWRVRVQQISNYEHITWSQYRLTPVDVENVVNGAYSYVGAKYNVAAFVALGVHHITGWRIPDCVAAWLNRRPYVTCSQMATQVMLAADVLPVPHTTVVCPGDWQRMFHRLGWM